MSEAVRKLEPSEPPARPALERLRQAHTQGTLPTAQGLTSHTGRFRDEERLRARMRRQRRLQLQAQSERLQRLKRRRHPSTRPNIA